MCRYLHIPNKSTTDNSKYFFVSLEGQFESNVHAIAGRVLRAYRRGIGKGKGHRGFIS
jgi:hypothetical protein